MNFNEYQGLAARTARTEWSEEDGRLITAALGIAGEAGEVTDYVKKYYAQGHDLIYSKLEKELGDVLWYISEMASACGMKLEDIAESNIEKLKQRYPDGFSADRSVNREEGE